MGGQPVYGRGMLYQGVDGQPYVYGRGMLYQWVGGQPVYGRGMLYQGWVASLFMIEGCCTRGGWPACLWLRNAVPAGGCLACLW